VKKIFFVLNLFIIISGIYALNDTNFILSLVDKKTATFGDAVSSFCYLNNINSTNDFDKNLENLKKIIPYVPKNFSKDQDLTYGDFSLLAIQQLKIKSGIFYLSTKTGRYAIRELMLVNLIPYNTSEYKKMSGPDLIKYLQKVTEYEVQ
jgi:hypothetical protein